MRPDPGDHRFEDLFKEAEELALDQLSGGYRIMLALAADLARRMAQGNPHLDAPLQAEAVVLINECGSAAELIERVRDFLGSPAEMVIE